MVRLLLLGILGFLIYSLLTAFKRSLGSGCRQPKDPSGDGEPMVKDPECGTYLPRSEAVAYTIAGRLHHFCSRECRDRFASKH